MPLPLETALAEIRTSRPAAPEELRRHVRLLRPEPQRRLVTRRRLVLVLAGSALAAAIVAGVLQRGGEAPVAGDTAASRELAPVQQGAPPASDLRLQDYRAELSVRVDDVPAATRRAMQIAQSLGGYVVSASYGGGSSDSLLVLRVPIGRAEDAVARLSSLGELAGQRFSLQDLQSAVDQLDAQADRLQIQIAALERQLRNPALTPGERVALRTRLDQAEQELQNVLAQRDSTVEQGRSAEISLTLRPRGEETSVGAGVIDRAVDALRSVWSWVLAVLIVGAPFAALLGLAFLAGRRLRRRANDRLLAG